MPTLSETLTAIYALQQIDTLIQRAKRAQSVLDNGTEATRQSEAAHDLSAQKTSEHHRISGELKDSELKLETLEAKRKSYQQKLYQGSVTNTRELANIEKEIEALGRQRSDLDGRVLELMEVSEQAQEALTAAQAEAKRAEGHRADILASYRARYDTLSLELSDYNRQRQERSGAVEDKALLKRYEDIRVKMGGVGIARLEGNACGGCHMTLPSTLLKAVKDNAAVQTCDNCGRLLLM